MTQQVDVKLTRDTDGILDITLDANGDLEVDDGFGTPLRLSIEGRRRATDSEVLEPQYRGGWIGNLLSEIPDFEAGSKLWLLKQARLTPQTLTAAKSYIEEGLEWFTEDGLAKSIEVSVDVGATSELQALITIDGEPFFFDLWNQTEF
jgi:phage gp46-like protein